MKSYFYFLLLMLFLSPGLLKAQKTILVDFEIVTDTVKDLLGGNKYFNNTAGLMHNEGIKQLRTHDYHHVLDYSDYSMFWNYDGTGNYTINALFDPYNEAHYNWNDADSAIDVIKDKDFDVFFRIGVSYPNPNILPMPPYDAPSNSTATPLNFSRFASLAVQTYKHYNEGWANGRFDSINYWEVWNEPGGLFWDGSVIQFYKMYQATADSLKNYAPDIKIGGPGCVPSTTVGANPAYRENFISYCSQNNVPLDFYSWHIYGAKNPYGIKEFADTIQNILNNYGYTQAESIITEINNNLDSSLDTLVISPYGAAYYLSTILTVQESTVDKLLWYPSCVGIKNAATGDTMRSRTYYAMTCFHTLQTKTPLEVYNDGNVVVEGNWNNYEDNFMVLSAKSEDDQQFSILISNLSGEVDNIKLVLQNMPFSESDSVRIIKSLIDADHLFFTTEQIVNGGNTITIEDSDCPASNVLFYQLEKAVPTITREDNFKTFEVISPAKSYLQCKNIPSKAYFLEVYSLAGPRLITTLVKPEVDVSKLPDGLYMVVLKNRSGKPLVTRKFLKQ